MHTLMTALRAAGTSIKDSGLEDTWCEAGLQGPTIIHQILEERAVVVNLTTFQAPFDLHMDILMFENPES